ncbi:MAG: hypothetical protein IPJ04_11955 [Candidatus Eisenbacteria bacterium]|nr:hypothetical protein [Candidatus Eisenbacteria bacterium]
MRSLIRAFAVCAVATLLLGAALAPRLRADGARDTGPLWASYPTCTLPFANTSWSTVITLPPYGRIAQPFPMNANLAACSLKVNPSYTFGRLDVVQWDAGQLQPDPTTVALRSVELNSSNMAWNWLHIQMSPPLVTRAIAHVAQSPSGSGAMVYTGNYPYNNTVFRYERAVTHAARGRLRRLGSADAAPGSHPVHGFSLCGGDASLQELRVVQSVMSTDVTLGFSYFDVLQRFRVPRRVRLQWVEFPVDSAMTWNSVGSVAILRDGMSGAFPPLEVPPALLPRSHVTASGRRPWVAISTSTARSRCCRAWTTGCA